MQKTVLLRQNAIVGNYVTVEVGKKFVIAATGVQGDLLCGRNTLGRRDIFPWVDGWIYGKDRPNDDF